MRGCWLTQCCLTQATEQEQTEWKNPKRAYQTWQLKDPVSPNHFNSLTLFASFRSLLLTHTTRPAQRRVRQRLVWYNSYLRLLLQVLRTKVTQNLFSLQSFSVLSLFCFQIRFNSGFEGVWLSLYAVM